MNKDLLEQYFIGLDNQMDKVNKVASEAGKPSDYSDLYRKDLYAKPKEPVELPKKEEVEEDPLSILEEEPMELYKPAILLKYLDQNLPKLEITEKGDCIDLRASSVAKMDTSKGVPLKKDKFNLAANNFPVHYKKGDVLMIGLGVAIKCPSNIRCNMFPRSSTFKNYGFILTNSVGIIDNSYSGNDDEWKAMVYCVFDGVLEYGDRLFQFEPVPVNTKCFRYDVVEELDSESRGGFGSTGRR